MTTGILTSWPLHSTAGSGVVTSVRGIALGLDALEQDVRFVNPVGPARTMTGTFLKRLFWNGRLPGRMKRAMRRGQLDALLAFDFDGCYLEPLRRPPLTVFCGGTLADILRFEEGWPLRLLRTQARLEAQNLQAADRVAVPSAYAREAVERHYGLASSEVAVVPLGVDVDGWDALAAAAPDPADLPRDPPVVLSVARCYRRKGLDLLLEAWARVRKGMGSGTLVLVGDGTTLPALRRQAASLGIASSVRFEGAVTDPALLSRWYRAADLFCMPSRHETFGLVYLEAALHGLPSVAIRTTAVPEVVTDGETGRLVEAGSDEETADRLAATIRDLLDHDRERLRLGAAARAAARSRTWKDVAADLLPLLGGAAAG